MCLARQQRIGQGRARFIPYEHKHCRSALGIINASSPTNLRTEVRAAFARAAIRQNRFRRGHREISTAYFFSPCFSSRFALSALVPMLRVTTSHLPAGLSFARPPTDSPAVTSSKIAGLPSLVILVDEVI